MRLHLSQPTVVPVSAFFPGHAPVDVLRLDTLHPVVSGNKWFKLKNYLAKAKETNTKTLVTFGGAYSNHLVATAAAAKLNGLQSIGIVRGEAPPVWSHSLLAAQQNNMQLVFVSRAAYRQKELPDAVSFLLKEHEPVVIPEGGYGVDGAQGAMDILLQHNTQSYTHVVTAVGTGTTLAGLVAAALPQQKVVGIPVLKNAPSLADEINHLLPANKQNAFLLENDYHLGGYAKKSDDLFAFMNAFYRKTGIPTDFVYTGKAVKAVFDLVEKGFFSEGSRILLVHTGGLQGNQSLKKGTLIFG